MKKEETHDLFNSSVGSKRKFSNTFFQIEVYFVLNFGDTALNCTPVRHLFTGIKILLAKISGRINYKPSMNPQKNALSLDRKLSSEFSRELSAPDFNGFLRYKCRNVKLFGPKKSIFDLTINNSLIEIPCIF